MYLSYIPEKFIHDEHLKYVDYRDVKKNVYAVTTYGRVINVKSGKELKQTDKCGYRTVKLRCINKKSRTIYVHRLVANAFIPREFDDNGIEKTCVNHKDLNPWNNFVGNLEWVTHKENVIHAYDNDATNHISDDNADNDYSFVYIGTGRSWDNQVGEDNNNARLNNDQVHMICQALEDGKTSREITEMIDIEYNRNNIALISSIRQGKRWSSISSQYSISKIRERKTKSITPYLNDICKMIAKGFTDEEIIKTIPHEDYPDFRFKYFLYDIRSGRRHQSIMNKVINDD